MTKENQLNPQYEITNTAMKIAMLVPIGFALMVLMFMEQKSFWLVTGMAMFVGFTASYSDRTPENLWMPSDTAPLARRIKAVVWTICIPLVTTGLWLNPFHMGAVPWFLIWMVLGSATAFLWHGVFLRGFIYPMIEDRYAWRYIQSVEHVEFLSMFLKPYKRAKWRKWAELKLATLERVNETNLH